MRTFLWDLALYSLLMTGISLLFGLVCRGLRGRYAAKWRYYSWLIILIGYLLPLKPRLTPGIIPLDAPAAAAPTLLTDGAIAPVTVSPVSFLFAVWLAGAALVLAAALYKHIRFCRMVKRLGEPVNDRRLAVARETADRLRISKPMALVSCPVIATPMIIGIRRPRILLPAQAFHDEELRLILQHELIHYKRKDLLFKIALTVIRSLHWFNPLMVPIQRMIQRECEISCDEAVTLGASPEVKKRYCQTILAVVTMKNAPATAFSTNFAGGKPALKQRLTEILSTGNKRSFRLIALFLGLTVAVGGALFHVEARAADGGADPAGLQTRVSGAATDLAGSVAEGEFTTATAYPSGDGAGAIAISTTRTGGSRTTAVTGHEPTAAPTVATAKTSTQAQTTTTRSASPTRKTTVSDPHTYSTVVVSMP